jgi:pyruvate dehydrogenase E1 component alpha subunit
MDPAEKAAAIEADPVPRFRARLIAEGIASEAALDELEAGIEADLDAAVEFALASPFPELSELTTDVYGEGVAA